MAFKKSKTQAALGFMIRSESVFTSCFLSTVSLACKMFFLYNRFFPKPLLLLFHFQLRYCIDVLTSLCCNTTAQYIESINTSTFASRHETMWSFSSLNGFARRKAADVVTVSLFTCQVADLNGEFFLKSSELFESPVYLEEVADVLCILQAGM